MKHVKRLTYCGKRLKVVEEDTNSVLVDLPEDWIFGHRSRLHIPKHCLSRFWVNRIGKIPKT